MPKQTEEGTAFTRTHHIVRKTTLYDMDIDPTRKYAVIGCQDRSIRFVFFFFFCNIFVINSSSSSSSCSSSCCLVLLVEPVFQENPGNYFANVFVSLWARVFVSIFTSMCFNFCNLIISRYLDSIMKLWLYIDGCYIYLDLIWQVLQSSVAVLTALADYHSGVCTVGWH